MLSHAMESLRAPVLSRRKPAVRGYAIARRTNMKRQEQKADQDFAKKLALLSILAKIKNMLHPLYWFYPVRVTSAMCINYGHILDYGKELWRVYEQIEVCADCGTRITSHEDVRKAVPGNAARKEQTFSSSYGDAKSRVISKSHEERLRHGQKQERISNSQYFLSRGLIKDC